MATGRCGIGPNWLRRREAGIRNPLGTCDYMYEQMYSSILPCGRWDHTINNASSSIHGGVFSLEFSPEGSLLVAACEKRSVLMFDPLTHKRIHTVENAHMDCVNCVKFLDSRSFATCSDDFTVALWDARNLSQKVRSLRGHANWVKNIEYSPQDGLLVTSGFDGNILTWEVNKYREGGAGYTKVFGTNGLMRTRLSPDASKMIICTTGGYLIAIHNLNLNTMSDDLDGFKPNMYRLMQLSQSILPIASEYTHLFRGQGKRNRVEFITDFPEGDDAEVVSSLQVHPDGNLAVSRNVTSDEQSEWSCVHTIDEPPPSDEEDPDEEAAPQRRDRAWPGSAASISTTPSYVIQHNVVQGGPGASARRPASQPPAEGPAERDLSIAPSDVWEALVAIQDARVRRERERATPEVVEMMRNMFRRRAVNAAVQVPLRSTAIPRPDHRIFVTRILPGATEASGEGSRDRRPSEEETPSAWPESRPEPRAEPRPDPDPGEGTSRGPAAAAPGRVSRVTRRKKVPLRFRYFSLYRRSTVGHYDRTSILRKPIYNPMNSKLKRSRSHLNTNYEMNETERLRSEAEVRESAPGSGVRVLEGQRSVLRRRINLALRSRLPQVAKPEAPSSSSSLNSTLYSLRRDLSSIENNLNSFRETVHNLEGTINSALEALRRRQNILHNFVGGEPAMPNVIGREEVVVTSQTPPEPPPPPEPRDGPLPRTVLMGIFRASNQDGARGTSMRRHNVAALTVSSSSGSQSSEPPAERLSNPRIAEREPEAAAAPGTFQQYISATVNKKIYQNIHRLRNYVEEPNMGRGFIKELCFSPDGRVICSPFGNGIRLLSFSRAVQDPLHCLPLHAPLPLHELSLNIAHTDIVVSSKFSPFHNLLVSGCLSGKIVYYQPML